MSRKKVENNSQKIHYLNRVLKSIRDINQLLIREKDRHKLVEKICDILVENHGFKNAWILLVDDRRNYEYAAANSSSEKFRDLKKDTEKGRYPACVNGALKNSNVQITDYQTCRKCQFFDVDSEFSGLSVKIQHNNRQFGVLTGYIKTAFIDEELKDLFREIANDLGFGLNDIEQVKEKEYYEALLKESETQLRNIFDYAPAGIFRTTLPGEILGINDEMARIMDFNSIEDAIAHYSDLEKKFYRNKNKRRELLSKLDQDGVVKNFTFQAQSKDGTIKWLSMNARLDKEKGFIDGFCRDVTKEYAIQKQLEWNEKHLQFIIEGGNLGTYTWFVKTGKTIFNEKWAEMLGYSLEELEPTTIETWKKMTHPKDLEKSLQKIEKLFNREIDHYETELRIKHKKGHWIWVLDKGKVAEWDEHGKPVKMSGIHTDITLLKKTTAKLEKSEQRYRSLFSNMTTGFALHKIITDETGLPVDYVYVEVNNAFEKMTGLKRSELLNKRVTDVLPVIKQDPADWIHRYGQVALKDETLRFENYSESLGKWFDVLAYSPQQYYFATIIDDITLRKETVRKLEASEKRFREVIEYNYVPMVITDNNQDIILFNKKFTDTFGWSLKDISTAERWWQVAYPDPEYREEVIRQWNRAVAKAVETKSEIEPQKWQLTCKNGQEKIVEFVFKSLDDINVIAMKDITEFEKKQQEIKNVHNIYRQTIENAQGVPYKLNYITEKYDFISDKCEELLGIPREKLTLAEVRKIVKNPIVTDPNGPINYQEYNQLFKSGQIDKYQVEFQIHHPEGETKWISDRSLTIKEKGKVIGSMGILQDISEIKTADEKLKYIHNIYRQTIMNARGIPYMFKYQDDTYTYLGEGFYELFGIDYGEITFDDVRKNIIQSIVVDHERQDDYEEYVRKFKNGEFDNYKVDLKIRTESGNSKWVADRAMPIKDGKSGKVIGAMGILQDITEQKQAEEALRKSEERFKLAIEGTQDGLWDWNLRTNHAYHSERFATMLGYEYGELPFTSKAWEDLLHPDDVEIARQNVEKYLKQKVDHYISTFRLRCKDGTYKWITGRGKALFDETGAAYRFLGFNTDITEQKKSEELNQKLEKQLRKKQKLETLGTLAGGIAHDFNNILTPIMGYSDMAIQQMDKDNQFYDHFNEISRAAFRAKDLVYQMLNFSRQSEQQRTPMNIVPVIKEALKLMRPSIPTTINIKTNIDKIEDKVLADATKIHQVVVNLCTNAFQAMEEKGGDLSIELKKVSIDEETSKNYLDLSPGEHLKLSIADTGVGMDAITKERIFEPFFTTKKVNKGTGLGLAVVHGIIQNHEGTITVYSEPDFGTTFNIFLPVFKGEDVNETPEDREDTFKQGTESILVVDDKVAVTKLLDKMLKALGYRTTVANSSQKGFELFRENPEEYQLLITDLTMPEMTGLELAERIHQIKPGTPVIMVTGYGNRVKQDEKEKAGITKLIGKPVLLSEISQSVRNIFDRMKKE